MRHGQSRSCAGLSSPPPLTHITHQIPPSHSRGSLHRVAWTLGSKHFFYYCGFDAHRRQRASLGSPCGNQDRMRINLPGHGEGLSREWQWCAAPSPEINRKWIDLRAVRKPKRCMQRSSCTDDLHRGAASSVHLRPSTCEPRLSASPTCGT